MRDLLKSKKAETRKLSKLPKTKQNRLAKLNAMFETRRSGKKDAKSSFGDMVDS